MPENLFNLRKVFHGRKTNYFGERRIVTLVQGDIYNYLIAAAPVFRAAIDARRQVLIMNGVYAGFKVDFLDAIMGGTFPLNQSFNSPAYVLN